MQESSRLWLISSFHSTGLSSKALTMSGALSTSVHHARPYTPVQYHSGHLLDTIPLWGGGTAEKKGATWMCLPLELLVLLLNGNCRKQSKEVGANWVSFLCPPELGFAWASCLIPPPVLMMRSQGRMFVQCMCVLVLFVYEHTCVNIRTTVCVCVFVMLFVFTFNVDFWVCMPLKE